MCEQTPENQHEALKQWHSQSGFSGEVPTALNLSVSQWNSGFRSLWRFVRWLISPAETTDELWLAGISRCSRRWASHEAHPDARSQRPWCSLPRLRITWSQTITTRSSAKSISTNYKYDNPSSSKQDVWGILLQPINNQSAIIEETRRRDVTALHHSDV